MNSFQMIARDKLQSGTPRIVRFGLLTHPALPFVARDIILGLQMVGCFGFMNTYMVGRVINSIYHVMFASANIIMMSHDIT